MYTWSIPIVSKNKFEIIENGYYKINLDGITHLVVSEKESEKYLKQGDIKTIGFNLIKKYNVTENLANGVMFMQRDNNKIKIHPVVWVKSIDTLFYETACGSGSIAVGIAISAISKTNSDLSLLQPSGKYIDVKSICLKAGYKVSISGTVTKSPELKKIVIGG